MISKSTSKGEGYIHRLTTKDIERIYKQDVRNERTTRRSYICTKDIEGFDLHIVQHGKFCWFVFHLYFFFFFN